MFEGRDLLALPEREMRQVRGARISLIFQEPMTALNPVMRVGDQMPTEKATPREGRERAVALLETVHIPTPPRARLPPSTVRRHAAARDEIALACHPALVIADEPTTALDVTIQAQVLDLLRELQASTYWRCSSSRTTSGSSPRWPTASPSCTRRHRRAGSRAPDTPDARARLHRAAGAVQGLGGPQVRRSADGSAARRPSPRQALRP